MAKDNRFVRIYSQDSFTTSMQIWVDKETGVNYLASALHGSGYGLTPLLNRDGTPVVSPLPIEED